MSLEIKRLETCISGFWGGVCAYINLKDYADENSVKCTIANIGDEIIPEKFAYDGTPYFSYDVFKKYAKGEPYANVYVEVQYDSKKLELDESVFNTAKGIDEYVVDLATLHHIMNIRSVAYHKKGMNLNKFVWRGILDFDQFGQTMTLSEQEYLTSVSVPYRVQHGTVDMDIFNLYCKSWTGSFKSIPNSHENCPVCGEKWTIDNIEDYISVEKEQYKPTGFHKNCLRKFNTEKQLKEFQNIFSKVYELKELKFRAIPNEYCSCERCASWFVVSTPDGDIKLGWRKRVINIEWLEDYKHFAETFKNEDVTKGFGNYGEKKYIHAWGIDKAVEYIRRAKESIIG